MQTLLQDARYAARAFARSPGFTAIVVLTLALGVGANAVIVSLIDTLYLRPIPVPGAKRIVHVGKTLPTRAGLYNFSFPDYLHYRDHAQSFTELAAHYASAPINLLTPGGSHEINGSVVTANYFTLLRLQPSLGRFFQPDEDEAPGRNPVAVISDDLWRVEFARDPGVLGRTIRLNGTDFIIVGVAPAGFRGVFFGGLSTEVWIPSAMFGVGYRYCDIADRDCRVVDIMGRLRDGRTAADAQAELAVLAAQLSDAFPAFDKGQGVLVSPARGSARDTRQESGRIPALLSAAVAVVLAIACANIAGLLLSRNLKRRKEIGIRLAIGAPGPRLVRQLLTESVLLSLMGGAAGLLVAFWAKDLLLIFYRANSEGQRANFPVEIDAVVIAVTVAVSVVSAIVFGLVPAVLALRTDLTSALKDGVASLGRPSPLRDVLAAAQLALSVVLLMSAGLLVRSVSSVYQGPGFDPRPIALLRLRPSLVAQSPQKAAAFQRQVIERLEATPGVVSASPAFFPQLPGWDGNQVRVWLPGDVPDPERAFMASYNSVGPRFFETLGVPIVAGRDFEPRDRHNAPAVAIVNETLARRFWPGDPAIGRTLIVAGRPHQVVGVARAAHYRAATDAETAFVYLDYWQSEGLETRPLDSRTHVRMSGDVRAMLPLLRREIAAIDPTVPISEDRPLTEWLDYRFGPVRAARALLTSFAVLALILSLVGLYGVLASAVSHRTREIAIRISLGAQRTQIRSLILTRALAIGAAGALGGVIVTVPAVRVLRGMLYGVTSYDPITIVAVVAILLAVTLVASYLPVRKATRVDPIVALRND